MDEKELINEKVHLGALVMANAGLLASAVIKNVAGNDISTAVNGSEITREMLASLTMNKVASLLASQKPV